ncbi:histidine-specific methyltransferase, SAM-dependent domain-containing protein [Sarocladium implicatum]|nr:histidine-specific methyltransferase, SAM-dependent domain-containing protein [Sarocladium implicatum]
MATSWNPNGAEIVDIGGSKLKSTIDQDLKAALNGEAYLPKEIAYSDEGMALWNQISAGSYQTSHELALIDTTAAQVVAQLPSGTTLVDMGSSSSTKFEGYLREFRKQGKKCYYAPLDLNKESLIGQVRSAKAAFPGLEAAGLWGNFEQGDRFYERITGPICFLNMGSIFFNAPEKMCHDRLRELKAHLGPNSNSIMVVGQDGPSGAADKSRAHAAYGTPAYKEFLNHYMRAVAERAGIQEISKTADPLQAWAIESKSIDSKHFFSATTKIAMTCTNFANLKIPAGKTFELFPSWKPDVPSIENMVKQNGLTVRILGKHPDSGMRQFLLSRE